MSVEPEILSNRQRRLYEGEKFAGWDPDDLNSFAEEVAHLHEELSEAFKEYRISKGFDISYDLKTGKPLGVPIEFADVMIGMYYLAEQKGFDLDEAVEIKHGYNLRRSYAKENRRLHEPESDSSPPTSETSPSLITATDFGDMETEEHRLIGSSCSCGRWRAGCGHNLLKNHAEHVRFVTEYGQYLREREAAGGPPAADFYKKLSADTAGDLV